MVLCPLGVGRNKLKKKVRKTSSRLSVQKDEGEYNKL